MDHVPGIKGDLVATVTEMGHGLMPATQGNPLVRTRTTTATTATTATTTTTTTRTTVLEPCQRVRETVSTPAYFAYVGISQTSLCISSGPSLPTPAFPTHTPQPARPPRPASEPGLKRSSQKFLLFAQRVQTTTITSTTSSTTTTTRQMPLNHT